MIAERLDQGLALVWFTIREDPLQAPPRRARQGGRHRARESVPTPAVWAQFLPPSTHFRAGAATHDVTVLRCAIEGETLRILDAKNQPVVLDAQPTLQLYILITSVVADALSRRDQETFDSLWELGADGVYRKSSATAAGVPGNPRRARIVEVQRRDKGTELFDDPKVLRKRWRTPTTSRLASSGSHRRCSSPDRRHGGTEAGVVETRRPR